MLERRNMRMFDSGYRKWGLEERIFEESNKRDKIMELSVVKILREGSHKLYENQN